MNGSARPRSPQAELLARLRHLFLSPEEDNHTEVASRISRGLSAMPRPLGPDDPYVATARPDMTWLSDFEALPDNGVDAESAVANGLRALRGQMRWHSLTTAHNLNQPVLANSWAAYAITSLYNPNALWDLVSGSCLDVERQVIRQLAGLMDWDPAESDGLFTFGGKGGFLYALRLGLNRCVPELSRSGFRGAAPVVLSTDQNHYTLDAAAALVNLGTDAVVKVRTTASGAMDLAALREEVLRCLAEGRPIACIVACGGNTTDAVVDPVPGIVALLDELDVRNRLGYRPWIHLDLAVGWPWLFFRDYDFTTNPLGVTPDGLAAARQVATAMAGTRLADSTCFDFHKLGFTPYAGSVFLTRHWPEFRGVFGDTVDDDPWLPHGRNFRHHHSLEHSRSGAPIVAAWVAMQTMGRNGFRAYLGHMHELTARLRESIRRTDLAVLNPHSPSLATMVLPRPAGGHGEGAAADHYVELLFRHVNGLDGRVPRPLAVGFVPGYTGPGGGRRSAALRLFLVNPFLDVKHIDAFVTQFVDLKREFDELHGDGSGRTLEARLNHTPK